MNNKHKLGRIIASLVLVTLIASCIPGGEAAPTIDPNLIYTEAAATVSAQLTANAPEPTLEIPTATMIPERPTPTLEPIPTQPIIPVITQAVMGSPIAPPTTVPDPGSEKIEDIPQFLGQFPPDGQAFPPGAKFDAFFTFKNNGDNDWNPLYSLRRITWKGESFGASQSKYLFAEYASRKNVHKGEETTIYLSGLQAPLSPGFHESWWCLYNNREDEGLPPQCIYVVSIEIVVKQ